MIEIEAKNIESSGDLKIGLINEKLSKEDTHIHTHAHTVHTEIGGQKQ